MCDNSQEHHKIGQLSDDIIKNGDTVTDLLKDMLYMSNEEIRKEVENV